MPEDPGPILSPEEIQKAVDEGQPGDGYDYIRDHQKIERDASAPPQQTDATPERVDLVGLLSDEFGASRSVIRHDLMMGTVTLDGEEISMADRLDLPREGSTGKTLEVKGGDTHRIYRVQIQ